MSAAAAASLAPAEILISYTVDPVWLKDPTVVYPGHPRPDSLYPSGPVVGLHDQRHGSYYQDTYVGSGQSTYPNPPSMLRVGQDR